MVAKTMRKAEELVEKAMKGNDASHDAWHVWRVRDLALSIAREEGLSSNSDSMEIVELAALLHDIGTWFYFHFCFSNVVLVHRLIIIRISCPLSYQVITST
ncbi:hypothetical protein AXX17_AT1G18180 [Arabidopsis thaliana]|uniref:HD domain-containing protein n=1 Tax=Arabidopsis thaliana TaxID=3702 RepID=A0A178WL10_ARATH|nr:hypothetical protein AXX17_AT1G18180 [Arabidopsis thaliana]